MYIAVIVNIPECTLGFLFSESNFVKYKWGFEIWINPFRTNSVGYKILTRKIIKMESGKVIILNDDSKK